MRYAVISKEKALGAGIAVAGHYNFGDYIAVNERELMMLNGMSAAGLDSVAQRLGGELMKESKVLDLIRKHKEKKNGK